MMRGMDEQTFQALMHAAEALTSGDYLTGYLRGLRRHYHGDSFENDMEHRLWISLEGGHNDLEQGYRDGFAGYAPKA
jgi:hypothetical protein